MKRVKLHLFRDWCQALNDAVELLPENADWPRELYTLLAENVPRKKRRLVMWTEGDVPIGFAAFAQEPRGIWEPVTQWIIPGMVGLAVAQRIGSLLALLPFRTRVAWWRMIDPIPTGGNIRAATEESTFGMSCEADFEAYWKQKDHYRTIKKARDRCKILKVSINGPGTREWVLRESERFWGAKGQPVSNHLANRMLAAEYLQRHGKVFTFALKDGEKFVAAELCIVHRQELVFWNCFRNRDYDCYGAGNRTMELACNWARNHGLVGIDIGGAFADYKTRWAPKQGTKAMVLISPPLRYAGDRARRAISSACGIVTNGFRRLASRICEAMYLVGASAEPNIWSFIAF